LADNILVEYANRWKSIHDYDFIKTRHDEIRDNVMLLKTASQQYDVNEDNLEIHEILDNFLVGTSKPKKYRSATDYSKLEALRKQDLRSTRKIVREKLKANRTKNVNHEENDLSSDEIESSQSITQSREPATFETYVDICKTIAAFRKCCPDFYDEDFLEELTGFRLLEHRASPFTVKRPGSIYQAKQKVARLVDIANHKTKRIFCRTKRPTCVTPDPTTESTTMTTNLPIETTILNNNIPTPDPILPIANADDSIPPVLLPQILHQIREEETEDVTTSQYKPHRLTCCICDNSSTKNINANFTCVPKIRDKIPPEKIKCNKTRRSYRKAKFYRAIFLRHLGLSSRDPRINI
jgi:hypothetical protein